MTIAMDTIPISLSETWLNKSVMDSISLCSCESELQDYDKCNEQASNDHLCSPTTIQTETGQNRSNLAYDYVLC